MTKLLRRLLANVLVVCCLTVIVPGASFAYKQWEWYAIKVVYINSAGEEEIRATGPAATFPTAEAALASLGTTSFYRVLTQNAGVNRVTPPLLEYRFVAPKAEVEFGPYEFETIYGQYSSEAAAYQSIVDNYQRHCSANTEPITLEPVNDTWAGQSHVYDVRESKMYRVIENCASGPWWTYRDILRRYEFACPEGYSSYTGSDPAQITVFGCQNPLIAIVRGGAIECPAGAPSSQMGNPCNAATGDKSQSEVDLQLPGIIFRRDYHSALPSTTPGLGSHWGHSYAMKLLFGSGEPQVLVRPNGYQERIDLSLGEYRSLSGSGTRLFQVAGEWVTRLSSGASEVYSAQGKLLRTIDENGLITTLSYSTSAPEQLSTIVGPFGHALSFSYVDGKISSILVGGFVALTYEYDVGGNLRWVIYQDGSIREYLYEDVRFPAHLTGIIDESGSRLSTYGYDAMGRVEVSEHHDGAGRIELEYTTTQTTVRDAAGLETTFQFNEAISTPRRVSAIQRGDRLTQFQLGPDSQRRVTREIDARNVARAYTYDSDHLLTRVEAAGTPLSRSTNFTYLAPESDLPTLERLSTAAGIKREIATGYDASRRPTSRTVTGPDGHGGVVSRTTTTGYTSLGQVQWINGPRNDIADVTNYTYHNCSSGDQCGQVYTITNAAGHTTTYQTYNAYGQPLTIIDPNGTITMLAYDQRQRLISRTVGVEQVSFEYWPAGLLKKTTLPDDSYLQYDYDAAYRLTRIVDSVGNRIEFGLDAMGNRRREDVYDPSNALSRRRSWVFNEFNELTQVVGAAGTAAVTTTFGYDDIGNQTSIAVPLGRGAVYEYDALNRLTKTTDANGGDTEYHYNELDQLMTVTDPRGLTTSYEYNVFGEVTRQTSPDSGPTSYAYDAAGNLATKTDARGVAIGQGTYSYDALNRVTHIEYLDHTVSYSYDSCQNGVGRLCLMTDASGTTSYQYDAQGRVTMKAQTVPMSGAQGQRREVHYTYTDGLLTRRRVLPNGVDVYYEHDAAGRISAIRAQLPGGNVETVLSDVLYDIGGRVHGWTWGNGTLAVREYDLDGRPYIFDSNGQSTFTYDDASRITAVTTDGGVPYNGAPSWSYAYDDLDRLTSASRLGLSRTYAYDANGNRTQQGGTAASTYSYSNPFTSNRLSGASGSLSRSYSYDASGNVIGDGLTTFAYDGAGRLKRAGGTQFRYNGLGQRVAKGAHDASWVDFTYFYDEVGHLLEKCEVTGTHQCNDWTSQQFIWLGDIPVVTLLKTIVYNEEGYLDHASLDLFNIHTDHLNTPRKLTRADSTNQLVWRWDPDPFGLGTPVGNLANVPYMVDYQVDLRFPGQLYDWETGLHYNYFRDYDPATGRYAQSDPIGLRGGLNTYSYVNQNPVLRTDPTGLVEWEGTSTGGSFFTAGATYFKLRTKECVNGKRGFANVLFIGVGLSWGVEFSASMSDVTLNDSLWDVNPNIFDGDGVIGNAGISIPRGGDFTATLANSMVGRPPQPNGIGCSAVRLGNAGGIGCGALSGLEFGIGGLYGSSTVLSSGVEPCDCAPGGSQ